MTQPSLTALFVLMLPLTFVNSTSAQPPKRPVQKPTPPKQSEREDPNANPIVIKGEITIGARDYKVTAGKIYTFRVKAQFRAIFAIYEQSKRIAYQNGTGGPENYRATIVLTPTRQTTYRVVVGSVDSFATAPKGPLKYSVDITSVVPKIVLSKKDSFGSDTPVYARTRGSYKAYKLKLKGGHNYQMIQSSRSMSCYLCLEDATGRIVYYGQTRSGRDSRIQYTPARDGTFRLIASQRFRRTEGSFTVQVLDLTEAQKK
ncbi:MAG: hypothetical protein ACFCD0_03265 [Gemmataceae bacterium]